jgi:hypothetical protein
MFALALLGLTPPAVSLCKQVQDMDKRRRKRYVFVFIGCTPKV